MNEYLQNIELNLITSGKKIEKNGMTIYKYTKESEEKNLKYDFLYSTSRIYSDDIFQIFENNKLILSRKSNMLDFSFLKSKESISLDMIKSEKFIKSQFPFEVDIVITIPEVNISEEKVEELKCFLNES